MDQPKSSNNTAPSTTATKPIPPMLRKRSKSDQRHTGLAKAGFSSPVRRLSQLGKPISSTSPTSKSRSSFHQEKNIQKTTLEHQTDEKARKEKLQSEHVFRNVGSFDLTDKNITKKTIFDTLLPNWDVQNCTVIELKNMDFNETISLTCSGMKTDKICNVTAAVMFGHTQGNPRYVR